MGRRGQTGTWSTEPRSTPCLGSYQLPLLLHPYLGVGGPCRVELAGGVQRWSLSHAPVQRLMPQFPAKYCLVSGAPSSDRELTLFCHPQEGSKNPRAPEGTRRAALSLHHLQAPALQGTGDPGHILRGGGVLLGNSNCNRREGIPVLERRS